MSINRKLTRGPVLTLLQVPGLAACGLATLAVAALALTPTRQALAEEAAFGFTYTTDLLPKGAMEVEQHATWRFTKYAGTFDEVQGRTEFEYGVSDRLQASFYVNYDWTHAFHNGPFGQTTPPEQFVTDNPDPDAHYSAKHFQSFSAEAIYRLLSPYTDPVGVALYIEPVRGPQFAEIETKLILHKNFIDDRLILAFNATWAPEWRWVENDDGTGKEWNRETDINFNFGASYRFAPNWSGGFEILNEHEANSYTFAHESNNGWYLGPTVHFGGRHFFVTATFVKQMPWASRGPDTVDGALVSGMIYDNDFEKYRLRVKFAYYF